MNASHQQPELQQQQQQHYRRRSASSSRVGLGAHDSNWTLIPASDLVQGQTVHKIDSHAHVEEACSVLMQHGVSSAPVYDATSKTYVGFFDYGDLVTYLLLLLKKINVSGPEYAEAADMQELFERVRKLQPVPVTLVTDLSHANPFYKVMATTPLGQVAEVMAKGVHRVAVMDEMGEDILGILSQSAIAKFLYQHIDEYPQLLELSKRTLSDLGLGRQDTVVSVGANDPIVQALERMSHHKITSVAVVEGGRMLGCLSLTDVRYLMAATNRRLISGTCFQLMQIARYETGLNEGRDAAPIFDVHPNSTLWLALAKLTATRAHRLFVTTSAGSAAAVSASSVHPKPPQQLQPQQSQQQPQQPQQLHQASSTDSFSSQSADLTMANQVVAIGVVSLTDIMRLLVNSAPSNPISVQ